MGAEFEKVMFGDFCVLVDGICETNEKGVFQTRFWRATVRAKYSGQLVSKVVGVVSLISGFDIFAASENLTRADAAGQQK